MRKLMTVLLLVAAIIVGYLSVMSILTPERFTKTRIAREAPIQVRLKEVAHVENAFHDVYNRYAPVDELRQFLTDGKVFYVRSEGDYTDAMREAGMNERQAAAKGLIVRDTVWVSARDSLLKDGMTPEEFLQVPGFPQSVIEIDTASVAQEIGEEVVMVPVFRTAVPLSVYLADQDHKLLNTAIKDAEARYQGTGYPGLALGSLKEVKNTGNWE